MKSVFIFGDAHVLTLTMMESLEKIVAQGMRVLCDDSRSASSLALSALYDAKYPLVRVYYESPCRRVIKDAADEMKWELYEVAPAGQLVGALLGDADFCLCLGKSVLKPTKPCKSLPLVE